MDGRGIHTHTHNASGAGERNWEREEPLWGCWLSIYHIAGSLKSDSLAERPNARKKDAKRTALRVASPLFGAHNATLSHSHIWLSMSVAREGERERERTLALTHNFIGLAGNAKAPSSLDRIVCVRLAVPVVAATEVRLIGHSRRSLIRCVCVSVCQ